jgi:2,4-diketo-3-deoxy-L-fuconate hydrolase
MISVSVSRPEGTRDDGRHDPQSLIPERIDVRDDPPLRLTHSEEQPMAFRLANVNGRATLLVDRPDLGPALGTLRGVDVERASGGALGPDPMAAIGRCGDLHALAGSAPDIDVDPATLECPVPDPKQVFAIGLNYRSHAEESGMAIPQVPMVFTKFPTSICGPTSTVELPSGSADWEAEVVVVIGRGGRDISEADALDHVAGLTGGQDISEREVQFASAQPQFSMGKSFATFGPVGPAIASIDSLADVGDVELWCELDGERVQQGRTRDLIFGVPALVAYLSSICELCPGDLIFTGTPAGVGFTRQPPRFLADGQLLVSHFDGIGTLCNPVRRG